MCLNAGTLIIFPHKVDKKKMEEAARILIGTHDFAAFTDKKEEKSTIRSIYDIMIAGQDGKKYRSCIVEWLFISYGTDPDRTLLKSEWESLRQRKNRRRARDRGAKKGRFYGAGKGLFLKEVY